MARRFCSSCSAAIAHVFHRAGARNKSRHGPPGAARARCREPPLQILEKTKSQRAAALRKWSAAIACPSEQESLFEYIAGLTSARFAAKRIRLLKDLPGGVP